MHRRHTKAEPLIHRPDMVCQPSCHGWGHRLPLLARTFAAFGWEGVWQALPQTAVWDNEVIVGKRQCQLMLQVVWVFGEGVHLTTHPAPVLAHGQIVALHAVGVDGTTGQRFLARRFHSW